MKIYFFKECNGRGRERVYVIVGSTKGRKENFADGGKHTVIRYLDSTMGRRVRGREREEEEKMCL